MRLRIPLIAIGATALAASVAVGVGLPASGSVSPPAMQSLQGIHKIRHVIVIMQENRSFDSYFGTYPGATRPGSDRSDEPARPPIVPGHTNG